MPNVMQVSNQVSNPIGDSVSDATQQNNAIEIERLNRAIERYCDDCHLRVEAFVARELGGSGAWRLNRHALGWDLLRVPLNIAWAPVWLLFQFLGWLFGKAKWLRLAALIRRIPPGMTTKVQRVLGERVERDVLKLDESHPDPLLSYLLAEEGVEAEGLETMLAGADAVKGREQFRNRWFGARTAVAEITTNISMAAVGAVLFKQFTPGALGGGAALAAWWTWDQAVKQFWAGEALGRVWYGWFPPETDWTARLLATGLLMVVLAVVASLSGFLTDPLQAAIGMHQRRLHKLVDHMQGELKSNLLGDNSTREQYLARVTDLLDWIALAGRAAS